MGTFVPSPDGTARLRFISALFMVLVGLAAAGWAVRADALDRAFMARAQAVPGQVVRIDVDRRYGHPYQVEGYCPVARYAVGGVSYTVAFGEYRSSDSYPSGATVRLLYDPAQPRRAVLDSPAVVYRNVWPPATLGAILGVLGVLVLLTSGDGAPRSAGPPGPDPDEPVWTGGGG
jgi:hypothetical protein